MFKCVKTCAMSKTVWKCKNCVATVLLQFNNISWELALSRFCINSRFIFRSLAQRIFSLNSSSSMFFADKEIPCIQCDRHSCFEDKLKRMYYFKKNVLFQKECFISKFERMTTILTFIEIASNGSPFVFIRTRYIGVWMTTILMDGQKNDQYHKNKCEYCFHFYWFHFEFQNSTELFCGKCMFIKQTQPNRIKTLQTYPITRLIYIPSFGRFYQFQPWLIKSHECIRTDIMSLLLPIFQCQTVYTQSQKHQTNNIPSVLIIAN